MQSRTSDDRKHIRMTVLDLEKIDFQGFLGIDVSWEEGGGSQRNVQRTFLGKKLICESSLIKTGLYATKKLKGDVDVPN